MKEPLLSVKEVAKILNITVQQVYRHIKAGLPMVSEGNAWRIRRSELDHWRERPRTYLGRERPQAGEAKRLFGQACAALGIMEIHLQRPGRNPRMVEKRWLVTYFLRIHNVSWDEIGAFLGRDHSTVMYGFRQVERRLKTGVADLWFMYIERMEKEASRMLAA